MAAGLGVFGCGSDPGTAARDSGLDAHVDASDDAQLRTDAAIEDLPCDALELAWRDFVDGHATCSRDQDCVVFERLFDDAIVCDNPRGLQAALNPDAVPDAQRFADRVGSTECLAGLTGVPWSHVGFDGVFLQTARCGNNQRCIADGPACGDDPDGGN